MRHMLDRTIAMGLAAALAVGSGAISPVATFAEGDEAIQTDAATSSSGDGAGSPDANAPATPLTIDAISELDLLGRLAEQGPFGPDLDIVVTPVDTGPGSEIAARVERFNALYEQARADVDALQLRIDENEARIAELEAAIPEQKARVSAGVRALYKFQQSSVGLVDLMLSADSFNDFVATVRYLDSIQEHNAVVVDRLVAMQDELNGIRAELLSEKQESDRRLVEAERALAEAEAAREEARRFAAEQAANEAAEIEAALEMARVAAASAQAASATFVTTGGNEAEIVVGGDPGQATITANEVDVWAERIDAYLAGSPLAGHGHTFAAAALASGVDPRWSPAISCIESSKGLYCFKPYNAWGWGSSVWPDWDTAIRAHVSGLASGYGYSITLAAAKKYCPPHWQYWYSGVSAEMLKI